MSTQEPTIRQLELNKQAQFKLVDELIGYYILKKKIHKKGYKYYQSKKDTEYFNNAAEICTMYSIDPGVYVDLLYNRMQRPEFFSPACLQGTQVRMYIKNHTSEEGVAAVDTIYSVNPADIWEQQTNLCRCYTKQGMHLETVLLDGTLKFYGWIRIMLPPERNQKIIDKYKHIAQLEITPKIVEFLQSKQMDVSRITGKK